MSWLRRLAAFIRSEWKGCEHLARSLHSLSVPVFLLAVLAGFMLAVDPAQDVLRNLADNANARFGGRADLRAAEYHPFYQWFWLFGACILAGISAWFWPLLLFKYGGGGAHGDPEPAWHHYGRRTLACVPLLIAMYALYAAAPGAASDKWADLRIGLGAYGLGLLFMLWLFRKRRRWLDRAVVSGRPATANWVSRFYRALGGRTQARPDRGEGLFFAGTLLVAVLSLVLFSLPATRDRLAVLLGPAAIVFLAFGSLIALASLLQWLTRPLRLPLLIALVLWAGVASTRDDNNAVRLAGAPAPAPPLQGQWDAWAKANPAGPAIIVAAAGGASRAAYWTGVVLAELDARTDGQFSRHTFAISSVSGGSLGAVGYTRWLAAVDPACRASRAVTDRVVNGLFGADYLAPAVAGLMYPGIFHAVVPLWQPSRADLLEQGWERGWRGMAGDLAQAPDARHCAPRPGIDLEGEFRAVWSHPAGNAAWVPLVFVNGTHVETGKRILTAPVAIDADTFPDSFDFYTLVPHGIRASTAIHNSARFPLVSPAGTLGLNRHIVDGGYFENSGLITAEDIARWIRARDASRAVMIIEIDNDDTQSIGDQSRHGHPAVPRVASITGCDYPHDPGQPTASCKADPSPALYEIRHIVGGLLDTRAARGLAEAKHLAANGLATGSTTGSTAGSTAGGRFDYYHVGLQPLGPTRHTSMSWLVSLGSRQAMSGVLRPDNATAGGRADYLEHLLWQYRDDSSRVPTIRRLVDQAWCNNRPPRQEVEAIAARLVPQPATTEHCPAGGAAR